MLLLIRWIGVFLIRCRMSWVIVCELLICVEFRWFRCGFI